jgi:hypothetical protein
MLRKLRKRWRAGWSVREMSPASGNMIARRFPPPWSVGESAGPRSIGKRQ